MTSPTFTGLYAQGQAIPLEGVRIQARLQSQCAQVTVTQRYHNREGVDVEAVYAFPLEEGAAVCDFRARVGERLVQGQVQEREEAFETYDDAMAQGHGAFLLDQERPNVFTASVGNLKAGAVVEVEVTYVAMLQREGQAVRFLLPTTISPRYTPASGPQVGQPDAERVNPPRQSQVPYGLTLEIDLEMASQLRVVESPSHNVRVELDGPRARVTLSTRETALDGDFVLLFEEKDAHKPSATVAQEEDGQRVAMVTFLPDGEALSHSAGSEIIFVIDRSGSMQGTSMEEARRATELCLRAMSEGDTFNLYSFGSRHESLWHSPVPYNQQNLERASQHLRQMQADLGGTEILRPLQEILASPAAGGRARQLLLLTDGQVSNEAAVIALCQQHRATARVFAFGIGAGVSEHLVRGVARASGGAAEFIYPGERIEPKVLRMFGRVSTPALGEVSVDWNGLQVEQAPRRTPPVFGGDALTVLARIRAGHTHSVTLRAGELSWTVPLDLEKADKGGPIPTLWARKTIEELEDGQQSQGSNQRRGNRQERNKEKIIELAKRYKLMSSHTSFVAVEERAPHEQSTAQARLRQVPVALTKGWHGQGGGGAKGMSRGRVGTITGAMASLSPPPPAPMAPPMAASAPPSFDAFGSFPASQGAPAPSAPRAPGGPIPSAPMPSAPKRRASMKKEESKESRGFLGSLAESARSLFGGSQERQDAKPVQARAESMKSIATRSMALEEMDMDDMDMEVADGLSLGDAQPGGQELLFDLLLTQQANGSFLLSPVLLRWLGQHLAAQHGASGAQQRQEKIREAARARGEAVLGTHLALWLLHEQARDRRAEWEVAARKARRWLEGQPAVDLDALLR